jgi:hypothetical protein
MILDQFRQFLEDRSEVFNGNSEALLQRAQEFADGSCEGLGKGQFLYKDHIAELLPDENHRADFYRCIQTLAYETTLHRFACTLGSAGS